MRERVYAKKLHQYIAEHTKCAESLLLYMFVYQLYTIHILQHKCVRASDMCCMGGIRVMLFQSRRRHSLTAAATHTELFNNMQITGMGTNSNTYTKLQLKQAIRDTLSKPNTEIPILIR